MKKTAFAMILCVFMLVQCAFSEECPVCGSVDAGEKQLVSAVTGVDLTDALGGLSIGCKTSDYGFCIQHAYSGSEQEIAAAAEEILKIVRSVSDLDQIYYAVGNAHTTDQRWYACGFLSVEHPEFEGFTMGSHSMENCHFYIEYSSQKDSDANWLTITHSASIPCQVEREQAANEALSQAAAPIEWHQMGTSGESFYYGQTDPDGDPEGFIVYESNQNATYYGLNFGGEKDELWDKTVIAVNREGDRVDSFNFITYDQGDILYTLRYFSDGQITYCEFENGRPTVRYDRNGDRITRQTMSFMNTWGLPFSVTGEEVQNAVGLGYASIEIRAAEEKKEDGLHAGRYLLIGVTDAGETVEILSLTALGNGSVEYTLNGETWLYDIEKNSYENIQK